MLEIADGGHRRITVAHPVQDRLLAIIDVEMGVEPGAGYDVEAIVVEVHTEPAFRGSNLAWTMVTRILTCIAPPQQDWDRYDNTMSAMAGIGHVGEQARVLQELNARAELCRSVPGSTSHWTHRKDLAGSSVQGRAVRAMCGVFFVPFQDHDSRPVCPECDEVRKLMPE